MTDDWWSFLDFWLFNHSVFGWILVWKMIIEGIHCETDCTLDVIESKSSVCFWKFFVAFINCEIFTLFIFWLWSMSLTLRPYCPMSLTMDRFTRNRKIIRQLVRGYVRGQSEVFIPVVLLHIINIFFDSVFWWHFSRKHELTFFSLRANHDSPVLRSTPFSIGDFVLQCSLHPNDVVADGLKYIGFFWRMLSAPPGIGEITVHYALSCSQLEWSIECKTTIDCSHTEEESDEIGWRWFKSEEVEHTLQRLRCLSFGCDVLNISVQKCTKTIHWYFLSFCLQFWFCICQSPLSFPPFDFVFSSFSLTVCDFVDWYLSFCHFVPSIRVSQSVDLWLFVSVLPLFHCRLIVGFSCVIVPLINLLLIPHGILLWFLLLLQLYSLHLRSDMHVKLARLPRHVWYSKMQT